MEGTDMERLLIQKAGGDEDVVDEQLSLKEKVWRESKKIWIVAAPAIFTRFSTFGLNVISQAYIGHVGSTELAAFSLIFTVLIRFANGILLGMASALETLCGQAYGAKQYNMLGVYLQRSWIVLTVCSLLLLPVFIFASPILKALGQDAEIADVAGMISLWLIPVMLSFTICFTCQMFLQAQSKNIIIMYLAAFALVFHIFMCWLLTGVYDFGLQGILTSTILAFWIPNLGQLMFVICGGCRETWKGFSTVAFKDLWSIIKLSLSSGIMLCLELWYNTILVLLTGNLANAEFKHQWMGNDDIPWVFAAASVRVSNELGRGSPKSAKFSLKVIVLTSFSIGFALFLFFLFLRERLAYLFTIDKAVVKAVGDLSPLLAVSILLNSVQPTLSGVAVGAGWQSIVAYVNIACYYLIGIPVGIVLGYVLDMHIKGVWLGMLFGTLVQTIVLMILTYKTDWDKQVVAAHKRINKWSVPEDQESRGNH